MGKIVVLVLCVFSIISFINGSCLDLESPSNPNPTQNSRECENVEKFEFEERMKELENFYEELKHFKSSLVELSAAFGRFHESVVGIGNGNGNESSTKPKPTPTRPNPDSRVITSCSDAMEKLPSPRPKKQTIYPHENNSNKSLGVVCDFETDGGGWTVIQKRRSGPKQEFNKTWNLYAGGFGSLDNNFWIGLDNIHALTKYGDQELRIELEDFEGEKKWTEYSSFSVSDASDFYRLSLSGFSSNSTAGDSMTDSSEGPHYVLDGTRFSTKDKDNDNYSRRSCAGIFGGGGGWWFNDCSTSNLNGLYHEKGETQEGWKDGIYWFGWKGGDYSLAKTEMKIRTRKSE